MKSKIYLFLAFLIVVAFAITSCKKDKTTPPVDDTYVPLAVNLSTSLQGLGANHGIPVGSAWAFPANIKVVGHILGGDPGKAPYLGIKTVKSWDEYVENSPKTNWQIDGLGEFVFLYMKLHNTGTTSAKLIFPAGLVFCNDSTTDSTAVDTTQTGIIVVPDTVVIPGGDTLNLCLKSFCTNPNRHAPTFVSVYKPRVVSNNNQVYHFINALKGKTTLPSHESEILTYIWQFTGGNPLTEADWATIASWQ